MMGQDDLASFSKSISARLRAIESGAALAGSASVMPVAVPAARVAPPALEDSMPAADRVVQLSLEDVVDSPFQPRRSALRAQDIADLAENIRANGQTDPILVSPGLGGHAGKFVVHSGHRRCAALRALGRPEVRAIVRADLTERDARRLALTANLGREDLSACEQAAAFGAFCDAYSLSPTAAAAELGISERHGKRLTALAQAPKTLVDVLSAGRAGFAAADALLKVYASSPKKALRLARSFVAGKTSLGQLQRDGEVGSNGSKAARVNQPASFKATTKRLRVAIDLDLEAAGDEQRASVLDALGRTLAVLGVERLDAVPVDQMRRRVSGDEQ